MSIPALLSLVLFFIRILIGTMLILAGILKIKAGSRWFLARVLAYDLVRGRVARSLATALPWLEVICGSFLVLGFLLPLTSSLSFVLLLIFTAAVVTAFLRDKEVDCGCFGRKVDTQSYKARWTATYRNLLLMGLLIFVYGSEQKLSMDAWLNDYLYQLNTNILMQRWLIIFWLALLFSTVIVHWLVQRRFSNRHSVPSI